jgi:glyoxylase-like metal-dependent hydrolase (beta-lactamase superfamily II)
MLALPAWAGGGGGNPDDPCPPHAGAPEAPQGVHDSNTACQQMTYENLATHTWRAGAADCSAPASKQPPMEIVQTDADTYVIRQNMCINFEAPFMYLTCGTQKCVLFDTGATASATDFPIRATIDRLLTARAAQNGLPEPQLVVAHSHSHGDHVLGDGQFLNRPHTTVVGHDPTDVAQAWGISNWPNGQGTLDLGGRTLTALPIPGHEAASIAVYDGRSHDLMTGDTLYPGRLYVDDPAAYRASVARLDTFVNNHEVRNVLGAHIELAADHTRAHPHDFQGQYHPNEHRLVMQPSHVHQLARLVAAQQPPPDLHREVSDDFILDP